MIEIKNLIKSFEQKTILDNLSFNLEHGERIALVGQNGSGKTTLIRCLLGLYQFQGNINILGFDIIDNREEALKHIAFVPQHPPSLKNTVRELIELTSYFCGSNQQDIENICDQLGLDLNRCRSLPFKALSGGMKQKLLIALAFARKPKMLIMDEPSANLDPEARIVFLNLLGLLPKETSMILTSHRVDELAGVITRLIELDQGKVIIDDFFNQPHLIDATKKQKCRIVFKKLHTSFIEELTSWSFIKESDSGLIWEGTINSGNSFQLLATLTRWSSSIASLKIDTQ